LFSVMGMIVVVLAVSVVDGGMSGMSDMVAGCGVGGMPIVV